MTLSPAQLDKKVKEAVRYFWSTRETQAQKQGTVSGTRDAGARTAVTGGAQMNGFIRLVSDVLHTNGVPQAHVLTSSRTELPGWFRAEKKWDLLVIADGKLLAGIEFKSQIGPSFGIISITVRRKRSAALRIYGLLFGKVHSSRQNVRGWDI